MTTDRWNLLISLIYLPIVLGFGLFTVQLVRKLRSEGVAIRPGNVDGRWIVAWFLFECATNVADIVRLRLGFGLLGFIPDGSRNWFVFTGRALWAVSIWWMIQRWRSNQLLTPPTLPAEDNPAIDDIATARQEALRLADDLERRAKEEVERAARTKLEAEREMERTQMLAKAIRSNRIWATDLLANREERLNEAPTP